MTPLAMRPRAVAASFLRHLRLFSSARILRGGRFTVAVPASASKQTVLEKIRDSRDSLFRHESSKGNQASLDNAAVVLASPTVAAWLEDERFMSSLLQQLQLSKTAPQNKDSVSVLSAVVDGLAAPFSYETGSSGTLSGLSIIHGEQTALLPGLWKDEEAGTSASGRKPFSSNPDTESVITVELPSLENSGETPKSSLQVALPLANTIFQNGRRSTLLASRWLPTDRAASEEAYKLAQPAQERTHQLITPLGDSLSSSDISAPLLAVTEPRKLVAGLGNIVRQVEVDGKPSPASRELESAIPALLAARRIGVPDLENTQMGVWGLVIPPEALPVYESLKHVLSPIEDHSAAAEQAAAEKVAANFTTLLSAGCRLHRVLSGGGGWGQKQGLLSLDPQTVHPSCPSSASAEQDSESTDDGQGEDAAMDSFIRSLRGETATQSSDVALQGAFVQFLVAPLPESPGRIGTEDASIESGNEYESSLVLGVPADYENDWSPQQSSVTLISDHFGAVSVNGIFVDGTPAGAATPSTRTKLDVPNSYIWEST